MIKKDITFKNFMGEEVTESFYFNMSKGELVKQQMAAIDQHTESFQDKLEKIGKNLQGKELVEVLDEIILDGYGERTTDGKNFVKVRDGKRVVERFMSSNAYSELVVELCTKEEAMSEFVNGLMPADLRDSVNKEVASTQTAREKSQASLKGFQKKDEKTKPTLTVVPEIPTIEGTADPIFVPADGESDAPEEPEAPSDYEAFKAWQAAQKEPVQ